MLKADAYGYLFRDIVGYLEALHGALQERFGDVQQSLEAMRILAPFVQEIVSFKDAIASWKVNIPQRYRNDRMIKDIDIKLIVPLRIVVATYRTTLSQLEATVRARSTHEELSQRRKQKLEAQRQKEDVAALRKQRWQRWQDLHVWRQQYEPDPHLRRRLFIDAQLFAAKVDEIDERDANGVKFERIPIFKERVSPPARRGSPPVEEEWTDEQMAALIDGLSSFAGTFWLCRMNLTNTDSR